MALPPIGTPLVELERLYWQAIKDKDAATADALTHYPCLLTGARGVINIKDGSAYAAMMASASSSLNDFTLEDIQVNGVTDGVFVIGYKVTEHLTVEGLPLTLVAYDSSMWVKEPDGHWRCALHTEAIAGDSFGRDRKG